MLYGTPSRAAHRASAGGGLALFVRGVGNTGQHRPAARRRVRREPQRAAQLLAQGLAASIVLSVTTLVGFFIVASRQPPGRPAVPLASRVVDPAPLSLAEVFPDDPQVRPPAAAPYRISLTHVDADCRVASVGTVGALLADHGCSQVVRAGLTAPYGDYRVTAGVFNLSDAAGAQLVDESLRRLVETGDGTFATLPAGGATTSQVGWRARGHYVLYCVITRAGGQLVTAGDPYAQRITADLVDGYLDDTVLERRASGA